MAETTPAGATPVVPGATPGQTPPPASGAQAATPPATDGDAGLGDAGKRAIDAMKAERDAAQRAARAAERALEELRLAGASESEKAIAKAKADGAAEVTGRFHDQIRRSEVKVALSAAGISPSVLDLLATAPEFATLTIGDDGSIDPDAMKAAIAASKSVRPDLFAAPRAIGSADGGAGSGSRAKPIYTRDQLADSKFFAANQADIMLARREGRIQG